MNRIADNIADPIFRSAFWSRVDRRDENECWPWLASCDRQGRGKFWVRGSGKHLPAPRIALIMQDGIDRDGSIFACHTCDNPNCVNPAHLWWGTRSQNMTDCGDKGRHGFQTVRLGASNPSSKLNEISVRKIRESYAAGESSKALAGKFGTNPGNIWKIVTGRAWTHVK